MGTSPVSSSSAAPCPFPSPSCSSCAARSSSPASPTLRSTRGAGSTSRPTSTPASNAGMPPPPTPARTRGSSTPGCAPMRTAPSCAAIHDDSVTDELDEFVQGRSVVGIMGGHALQRGLPAYAAAAGLGHALAEEGHLVATGGGPGAMEAANLGALCRSTAAVEETVGRIVGVPGFRPDITPWAATALAARDVVVGDEPRRPRRRSVRRPARSASRPGSTATSRRTSSATSSPSTSPTRSARRACSRGRTPGSSCSTAPPGPCRRSSRPRRPSTTRRTTPPLPPLVLVGRAHWTERVPVWTALQALAAGRPMSEAIHLVDSIDEVLPLLAPR